MRKLFPMVLLLLFSAMAAMQARAEEWADFSGRVKSFYADYDKKIKSLEVEEELVMRTRRGEQKMESTFYKKGGKFRIESVVQLPPQARVPKGIGPMRTVVIYDGQDMWSASPFAGTMRIPMGREQMRGETDWWSYLSESAQITGSEKINGRDCHIVSLRNYVPPKGKGKQAPFDKMWIDKKDLVLVKAETLSPRGNPILIEYSDFKKLSGPWQMAHRTDIYSGGLLANSIIIKSAKVNANFNDSLFDVSYIKWK